MYYKKLVAGSYRKEGAKRLLIVSIIMVHKFKKGFTLIELLVVIAIIGILAAVILSNLGEAKNVARDGAVKSQLTNIRGQAELYAQTNGNNYAAAAVSTCTAASSMFDSTLDNNVAALITGIGNSGGTAICGASPTGWAVSSSLPSGAADWCVDSSGQSVSSTIVAGDTSC